MRNEVWKKTDRQWDNESNEQYVDNVAFDFFYQPRTLSLLAVVVAGLIYAAFVREPASSTTYDNVTTGLIAVFLTLLSVSLITAPNGPFVRPHPALWRLVFGATFAYLLTLVLVLFQSPHDLSAALNKMYPEIGHVTNREGNTAQDCSLSWLNVYERVDVFITAHFLGWVVKALLLRSAYLCWVVSVLWEVTELIFAGMLPNFTECWWDAIVFDIFLANNLGIIVGTAMARYLEMRRYSWHSLAEIDSTSGKLKRLALQFTPVSWTSVDWDSNTGNVKRISQVLVLVVMLLLTELNTFFLKHILLIPTKNPINIARLALISLGGAPALRQFYVYITDKNCKRMGSQCWMMCIIVFTELLVCIKYGQGLFPDTNPLAILSRWAGITAAFCGVAGVGKVQYHKWRRGQTKDKKQ